MKTLIKVGIASVWSFSAGYAVAHWHMKNYYATLAEGEIQDAREEYKRALRKVTTEAKEYVDNVKEQKAMSLLQEMIATGDEVAQVAEDRQKVKAGAVTVTPQRQEPHDYTKYHKTLSGDTQTAPALATIEAGVPSIVTEQEYMNTDQAEIVYFFTGDDVMCDENMEPMTKDRRKEILGFLEESIGEYMNAENNVFVWNPTLGRAYQIVIEVDSYGEGVTAKP